jgi:hypothetical protein
LSDFGHISVLFLCLSVNFHMVLTCLCFIVNLYKLYILSLTCIVFACYVFPSLFLLLLLLAATQTQIDVRLMEKSMNNVLSN